MADVRAKVRDFIEDNLNIYDDEVEFSDSADIFKLGFVDSMFALKLVGFVEQEFGVKVSNEDMVLSNFSSVDNLVAFVDNKQS